MKRIKVIETNVYFVNVEDAPEGSEDVREAEEVAEEWYYAEKIIDEDEALQYDPELRGERVLSAGFSDKQGGVEFMEVSEDER